MSNGTHVNVIMTISQDMLLHGQRLITLFVFINIKFNGVLLLLVF